MIHDFYWGIAVRTGSVTQLSMLIPSPLPFSLYFLLTE